MISLKRWKAWPNLECFLSLVVRVLQGFRLKLKSRWRYLRRRLYMKMLSMLCASLHACNAAFTQSNSVDWRNLVAWNLRKRLLFLRDLGGAVVQSVVQVGSVPYTSCCK